MLSYVYIETKKESRLPDLSKEDIKKFHMIFWRMIRQSIIEEKTFRILGTLKFYLKRKQLKRRYEKQKRKEQKTILNSKPD